VGLVVEVVLGQDYIRLLQLRPVNCHPSFRCVPYSHLSFYHPQCTESRFDGVANKSHKMLVNILFNSFYGL